MLRRDFSSFQRAIALTVAVAALPAAAAGGKREMDILQTDVDELQRQVYEMRQQMTLQSTAIDKQSAAIDRLLQLLGGDSDVRAQLAAFNANIDALRTDIRRLGARFDQVAEQVDGLTGARPGTGETLGHAPPDPASTSAGLGVDQQVLEGQQGEGSAVGGAPDSQALYNQAYADYLRAKYDLAIKGFTDYLASRPRSALADNAQYWIAMGYFNQGAFADAVREFDALLSKYPDGDNLAEALYRKGVALQGQNRLGQAVLVLNDVILRYPDSEAAAQAQARLREMASSGSEP